MNDKVLFGQNNSGADTNDKFNGGTGDSKN